MFNMNLDESIIKNSENDESSSHSSEIDITNDIQTSTEVNSTQIE